VLAPRDALAGAADAARVSGRGGSGGRFPGFRAIHGLRQGDGRGAFAHAVRAGKQQTLGHTTARDRLSKEANQLRMADDIG
jgi:hypothetical protein